MSSDQHGANKNGRDVAVWNDEVSTSNVSQLAAANLDIVNLIKVEIPRQPWKRKYAAPNKVAGEISSDQLTQS
jgi:hypothetical protein